jgi:hypothetical protein
MSNAVGILLGFALTTVAGGWWASRLQQRSWVKQNDEHLKEGERDRAGTTCQHVMSLLDRRLYRMQRLLWAASTSADRPVDDEELERRRTDYVEVLFAWNDSLNTNLSLVGSYFGDDARAYLDHLYAEFKRVGRAVEELVRLARAGQSTEAGARRLAKEFEGGIGTLNDEVYQFGLKLMSQLRDDKVGRRAPNTSTPKALRSSVLA